MATGDSDREALHEDCAAYALAQAVLAVRRPATADTLTDTEREAVLSRLAEAEEAWLWHEETDDTIAGYGYHMMQMLYRLPRDGQTDDMKASIEQMLADLRILADRRTGEADLRARLADDVVVEAAAREAFWTDDMGGHHKPGSQPHTWENIPEVGRENYRTLVRAVLRAALATDPEES